MPAHACCHTASPVLRGSVAGQPSRGGRRGRDGPRRSRAPTPRDPRARRRGLRHRDRLRPRRPRPADLRPQLRRRRHRGVGRHQRLRAVPPGVRPGERAAREPGGGAADLSPRSRDRRGVDGRVRVRGGVLAAAGVPVAGRDRLHDVHGRVGVDARALRAGADARAGLGALGDGFPARQPRRAPARRRAGHLRAARAVRRLRGDARRRDDPDRPAAARPGRRRPGRRARRCRTCRCAPRWAIRPTAPPSRRRSPTAGRCSGCASRSCRCFVVEALGRRESWGGIALAVFAAGNAITLRDRRTPHRPARSPSADAGRARGLRGRDGRARPDRRPCRCSSRCLWSRGWAAGW